MPPLDTQPQEHFPYWDRALQLRTHGVRSAGGDLRPGRDTHQRAGHLRPASDTGQSKERWQSAQPSVLAALSSETSLGAAADAALFHFRFTDIPQTKRKEIAVLNLQQDVSTPELIEEGSALVSSHLTMNPISLCKAVSIAQMDWVQLCMTCRATAAWRKRNRTTSKSVVTALTGSITDSFRTVPSLCRDSEHSSWA